MGGYRPLNMGPEAQPFRIPQSDDGAARHAEGHVGGCAGRAVGRAGPSIRMAARAWTRKASHTSP